MTSYLGFGICDSYVTQLNGHERTLSLYSVTHNEHLDHSLCVYHHGTMENYPDMNAMKFDMNQEGQICEKCDRSRLVMEKMTMLIYTAMTTDMYAIVVL